ncbi:MAG: hypothetical protein FJY85_01970 [Deltaproteobacteria bacterium]|nr:hypothetical protein [Deltaproteobacteria bacterium]
MEQCLSMAAMTRDYHPRHVVPDIAARSGDRKTELHSSWISGLIEIAVRRYVPEGFPEHVAVTYHSPAYQGTTLFLTVRPEGQDPTREGSVLRFEVRDGRRRLVATGEAVMGDRGTKSVGHLD